MIVLEVGSLLDIFWCWLNNNNLKILVVKTTTCIFFLFVFTKFQDFFFQSIDV